MKKMILTLAVTFLFTAPANALSEREYQIGMINLFYEFFYLHKYGGLSDEGPNAGKWFNEGLGLEWKQKVKALSTQADAEGKSPICIKILDTIQNDAVCMVHLDMLRAIENTDHYNLQTMVDGLVAKFWLASVCFEKADPDCVADNYE